MFIRTYLKAPTLTPLDLSGRHNEAIYPAMTDEGICHVYNGNAMGLTYKAGRAEQAFSEMDER